MKSTRRKVIVVREDAYKQNTVYRPWTDIISHKSNPISEPVAASQGRQVRHLRPVN